MSEVSVLRLASAEVGTVEGDYFTLYIKQESSAWEVLDLGYMSEPTAVKVLEMHAALLDESGCQYEIKLSRMSVVQHKIGGMLMN